jgi:putative transcriptional regulator
MTEKTSELTKALLETADDLHSAGLISDASFEKITVRHLGPEAPAMAAPITGEEIRRVRERARLSQAAFAKYVGLTAGYVSQLERGTRKATGPTLTLFNVIRRVGVEVLL